MKIAGYNCPCGSAIPHREHWDEEFRRFERMFSLGAAALTAEEADADPLD